MIATGRQSEFVGSLAAVQRYSSVERQETHIAAVAGDEPHCWQWPAPTPSVRLIHSVTCKRIAKVANDSPGVGWLIRGKRKQSLGAAASWSCRTDVQADDLPAIQQG